MQIAFPDRRTTMPTDASIVGCDSVSSAAGRRVVCPDPASDGDESGVIDHELRRYKKLIESELKLAADVQRAVLPRVPELSYLEICVQYLPHGPVSGDVYDFLENRERELGVFVGDVTGHGIAAALVTMMVHLGLDSIRRNLPTDETVRRLNARLVRRETGRAVTGVFFRLTPAGYLHVTHAAHPSIIIIPADGRDLRRFSKGGCALGVFAEEPVSYEEECYRLRTGDKVFAFTDGVVEWRNPAGAVFSDQGLQAAIESLRGQSLGELVQGVVQAARDHAEGGRCADDLTVVAVEYQG